MMNHGREKMRRQSIKEGREARERRESGGKYWGGESEGEMGGGGDGKGGEGRKPKDTGV